RGEDFHAIGDRTEHHQTRAPNRFDRGEKPHEPATWLDSNTATPVGETVLIDVRLPFRRHEDSRRECRAFPWLVSLVLRWSYPEPRIPARPKNPQSRKGPPARDAPRRRGASPR